MTQVNKQVRLAARPSGLPTASDWTITSEPVPDPAPGAIRGGEGRLVAREHIVHGSVTDFPKVLLMLFTGENTGKLILATGDG